MIVTFFKIFRSCKNDFKSLAVIIVSARSRLIRLPREIVSLLIYQTPIQTGGFLVFSVFGMTIAKDQITALLVQVVVMLAPRGTTPFVRTRSGPGVPLRVRP